MVSNASRLRLSFALGSWQIVALAAGLAEADAQAARAAGGSAPPVDDVLVLYETGPAGPALVDAMQAVAGAARRWKAVIEAFEPMASASRTDSQARFDTLRAMLRERIGGFAVDELWLCRVTRVAERLAMETWPDARVMLYEDGVLSYLPMPATPRLGTGLLGRWRARRDERRPVRRLGRWKDRLDPRHADRIAGAWMLLADAFTPPATLAAVPWHAVPAARLREVIDACQAIPAVAAFAAAPTARPAVLVLGQALSRFHAVSREAERRVYADAVAAVVARGYDVWWKEHPRAVEPFYPELAAATPPGRLRELELPFALPVELVADRLGLVACVGGITTALFYLPRLLGIAPYTFAGVFAAQLRGGWALQNRLFVERIAPLDALPPANPTP